MEWKRMKNPFIDESALEEKPIEKSEYEKMVEQAEQHTEVVMVETYMTRGLLVGMIIGIVAGFVTGKMSHCFAFGMLIGLAVGICFKKKPHTK